MGVCVPNFSVFSGAKVDTMSGVHTGPGATAARDQPGRCQSKSSIMIRCPCNHQVATRLRDKTKNVFHREEGRHGDDVFCVAGNAAGRYRRNINILAAAS